MANPRQRHKSRSSSYKPVRNSRHTNKLLRKQPRASRISFELNIFNSDIFSTSLTAIRGPKFLQDAWDKRKTVRQKYVSVLFIVFKYHSS